MPTRSHDDAMGDYYTEQPEEALQLLNEVLADGEWKEMLILLRQMTKARGGVSAVAEKASLNSTQLYRTLSASGNPTIGSLVAVLNAMGLRLTVQPASMKQQSAA